MIFGSVWSKTGTRKWSESQAADVMAALWSFEPALNKTLHRFTSKKKLSKHTLHRLQRVFVFVSHVPCKISSVLCVIVHVSTQSVVSLSARESFQGAEEFTQTLELSVGGIGNCKDKSLRQLKPSFLFTRGFGIAQISQIYRWRSPALIRILNPVATS